MKKHWADLDHQVRKILKDQQISEKKFLLCVSGGADSMALLNIFSKIHKLHLFRVFHFHHGPGGNEPFRDQAQKFVSNFCEEKGIEIVIGRAAKELKNETESRRARKEALVQLKTNEEIIVTAHHQQDLLETRLIRLIRGTGAQGIKSMAIFKSPWLKPLLSINSQQLKEYLSVNKQTWVEDPTNKDNRILRNWIRNVWLPKLDLKRKGAVETLARSLDIIAENRLENNLPGPEGNVLRQSFYLKCSRYEQLELLSKWFYNQGIKNYSRAHIEEIQKQLDQRRNNNTIKVGPVCLQVNAQQILLIRQ